MERGRPRPQSSSVSLGDDLDRAGRPIDADETSALHVLYWTAYAGDDGDMHFAPDVYGRDAVLDEAMRNPPPRF